ncbi:carotenoid biosynthesis protein [Williamsia sterculiae]|uniref:Putative membrane protein n=1 Tax=Williamsia sterculiae TaxID=1344003 RepID=A0A1N7H6Z2_9NOCA|nr:carotenoid biosynthesis protein [Williamsia sterculiae]SIS20647.1 putative membrane protein [Williamsia sterculiae]
MNRPSSTVAVIALGVCIAAQITYPLVTASTRDATTVAVVLAGVVAMVAHARAVGTSRRTVAWMVAVPLVTFVAETVGTRTGFPFGAYHYATDRVGPAVASVPLVVTLAWFVGVYSVWRVACWVFPRRRVVRVVTAVVAMLGWDLYLDPQMVAEGLWTWEHPHPALPGVPDVPLTNYAGWVLVAVVVFALVAVLDRVRGGHRGFPVVPGVWFAWTWLGSALAHLVFLDDRQLAVGVPYGLVAMGVLGVPAAIRAIEKRTGRTR